ncbi:ArsR/SmtB family transcription factor [Loigolactobacillus zhaoyuanensis]|uniref:ArsR/SmtB family transcription factor n=1 Tax=Loigolactobacillus zhaoyuanensis TaxID=2486017 RepID=A0ABW8UDW7_9LACO
MTVTQEKLLHALNNRVRLAILEALKSGKKNVTELTDLIDAKQSNISQHLACLRGCGLIQQTRQGKYYYYEIVNTDIIHFLDEMTVVINSLNWTNEQTKVTCQSHMP